MASHSQTGSNLKGSLLRRPPPFSRLQLALFLVIFAVVGGYILLRSFAATTNPITSLPDGTLVHRGNSCPATGLVPMVISLGHTGPQSWESMTHWIEAADQYCFEAVLPYQGNGGPSPTNLLQNYGAFVNGGSYVGADNVTRTSLGFLAWAKAAGGDPMKIMGTGFSAGTGFWFVYLSNFNTDPAGTSVIAVGLDSGWQSTKFAPVLNRTKPIALFQMVGTNDVHPYIGDTGVYGEQASGDMYAKLAGWNGTTAPTKANVISPWIWEFKYPTKSAAYDVRYWVITGGHGFPPVLNANGNEMTGDGGIHYWPGGYALPNAGTPSAGDNSFHATDEFSKWFKNTVLASSTGGLSNPLPTVSLTASPASITSGSSSTLSWSSSNATSCTASGAWSGAQATAGTKSVSPTANSTYTLACSGAGGSASASSTVTVSSSPPPTGGGKLNTVSKILYDMQPPNESNAHGGLTGSLLPPLLSYNIPPPGTGFIEQWGQVYADLSNIYPANVRAAVKNVETYIWSISQGKWVRVQAVLTPGGALYTYNFSSHTAGNKRIEPDGSLSMILQDGYLFHFFPTAHASINSSDVGGVFTTFQARLILDNPTGPNNIAQAKFVTDSGADFYPVSGSSYPWTAQQSLAVGGGKLVYLSGNWQAVNFYTGGPSSVIASGKTPSAAWTEARLQANPPPLDAMGTPSGGGTTQPPTVSLTASPTTITSGSSSTLTWSSSNASSCTASGAWSGAQANSGTKSVSTTSSSTYTLSCTNSAGSASASAAVSVTQPTTGDTTPPTVSITNPSNGATVNGTLNDSASATDNVGVTKVEFYVDGTLSAADTSSPYNYSWNTTLLPNGSHTLIAKAYDAAGNTASAQSAVTTKNGDTTPPSVPSNITATASSATQINLTWSASTDNVGVAGYYIVKNGTTIAQISGTTYSVTSLSPSTSYNFQIMAYDAAGNVSAISAMVSAKTQSAPDTTPPSVPSGLVATPVSSSQINLSWSASTDNIGVAGYYIYRSGIGRIGSSTTANFGNTGLLASTSYTYYVIAYDAAGNQSTQSLTAKATTMTPSPTSKAGSLNGFVANDDKQKLSAAIVVINYSNARHIYITPITGYYNFRDVPINTYRVGYSKSTYYSQDRTVVIYSAKTTTVNVALKKSEVQ